MASSRCGEEEEPFLMRTPPTSVAGWIGPVLLYLTVSEAMRLERTSVAWRRWLAGADEVWRALAATCGVFVEARGPLARYFEVASWRRVCCELVGRVSLEVGALEARPRASSSEELGKGTIVELADGSYGEIVRPLRAGRNGKTVEEYTIRSSSLNGGLYTVSARNVRFAPTPRTPRWWRAVATLEVEDQAARDFCCGVSFRFWRAEAGGVFTFAAARATPVHYRRDQTWAWSPDRVNWMPCTTFYPVGARWRAHSLVEPNRQIARFLDRYQPTPPDFCLAETTASVVVSTRARSRSRRLDDDLAARSARRAVAPDAHGGILALANTHVHVVHAPFERPTHLLHVEPSTIADHPGGWINSTDGGSTWALGHGGLLSDPTAVVDDQVVAPDHNNEPPHHPPPIDDDDDDGIG